jgi:hypothetical protein
VGDSAATRSGRSNPFGKLDDEIQKFRIDSLTKASAAQLATAEDMTLQEWVRELIRIRVHGRETVKKLLADRIDGVAGMGNESGGGKE